MLKNIAKFSSLLIAIWIVLYVVGGFTVLQSTVLNLLVALILWRSLSANSEPAVKFMRHRFTIRPRWDSILLDLGLVDTPGEYDALCKRYERLPSGDYNVFRDGLCFTILDVGELVQDSVIYLNSSHSFTSRVDFEEGLSLLTLAREAKLPEDRTWHPKLFVCGGVGGYDLGVVVDQCWWEAKQRLAAAKPAALHVQNIFDCGIVRLTLAVIPRSESIPYLKQRRPNIKGVEVFKKHREDDRTESGWVAKETKIVTLENTFFDLAHKYFHVLHHSI